MSGAADHSSASSAGRVIVISGASGAGKTTIARSLLKDPRYRRARTATTRSPRAGEQDGRDYDFLTAAEFRSGLGEDRFIEHADVYGKLYGTPRANLEEVLRSDAICVLVVDVQGARSLRELGFEAFYVFVEAPEGALRRRLEGRGKDAPEVIEARLEAAAQERREAHRFDVVLVNEDIEETTRRLAAAAGLDWHPAPRARQGAEE